MNKRIKKWGLKYFQSINNFAKKLNIPQNMLLEYHGVTREPTHKLKSGSEQTKEPTMKQACTHGGVTLEPATIALIQKFQVKECFECTSI
ncbi:MAG: hypothetical protein ACM3RX_03380 [Methanococcaceae archaeon]